MDSIDQVFDRIRAAPGGTFYQVRGAAFTYEVRGAAVCLDRTNRNVGKAEFAKALERCPLTGPAQLHNLQAPSYIYAILTDPRVGGLLGDRKVSRAHADLDTEGHMGARD